MKLYQAGFCIRFKTDYDDYNIKTKNAKRIALKKMLVALAGPLVNVVLILIIQIYLVVTGNKEIFNITIEEIIYSNLLIFIFNMIPIYPLDGGRIIKEFVHIMYGLMASYEITNKISNISIILLTMLTSIFILKYKNIAVVIILVYLWFVVIEENKKYKIKHHILEQYIAK